MIEKILVPLDGSHRAETILPHVEEIALFRKATVILVQVLPPLMFPVSVTDVAIGQRMEDLRQRAEDARLYLAGIQGMFREKGIAARKVTETGPVVDAILAAAAREGVDLIAMASHGRSGLSRVFYGSVAAGILQRVDRPLLLVRSRRA
jgi:nucleotide-binding universal stress UspA family protein